MTRQQAESAMVVAAKKKIDEISDLLVLLDDEVTAVRKAYGELQPAGLQDVVDKLSAKAVEFYSSVPTASTRFEERATALNKTAAVGLAMYSQRVMKDLARTREGVASGLTTSLGSLNELVESVLVRGSPREAIDGFAASRFRVDRANARANAMLASNTSA